MHSDSSGISDTQKQLTSSFRGLKTREQMLRKGMEIFSRFGPEGVSTRRLAREAGVNVAAIQYYFGGKEGYYLAVVRYVLDQVEKPVFSMIQWAQKRIAALRDQNPGPDQYRRELAKLLYTVVHTMVSSILQRPEAQYFASISTREHLTPTSASEVIYAGISRFHETISLLVGLILDIPPDSDDAIIRAHAIVGQILIFRFGAATLYRRMGISSPDRDQIHNMATLVAESVCMGLGIHPDRSFLQPIIPEEAQGGEKGRERL